jgi:diguanylate cyclase (GGDEF)-like protein
MDDNTKLAAELVAARARIAELEAMLAGGPARDAVSPQLITLRVFRAQLELDVQRAARYRRPLAAARLDIDSFRTFNLTYGYGAGDRVLSGLGAAIAAAIRTSDVACRIGGDEFAILFTETDAAGAEDAIRRILGSLENFEADGVPGQSVSVGIAMLESGQSPEALLAAAGSALETARAAGGNRTVTCSTGNGSMAEPEGPAAA